MNGITDSMNGKLKIFKSYDEGELEKQVNDYIASFKKEHDIDVVFYDIDFKVAPYTSNPTHHFIYHAFVILSTSTGISCDDEGTCECDHCRGIES